MYLSSGSSSSGSHGLVHKQQHQLQVAEGMSVMQECGKMVTSWEPCLPKRSSSWGRPMRGTGARAPAGFWWMASLAWNTSGRANIHSCSRQSTGGCECRGGGAAQGWGGGRRGGGGGQCKECQKGEQDAWGEHGPLLLSLKGQQRQQKERVAGTKSDMQVMPQEEVFMTQAVRYKHYHAESTLWLHTLTCMHSYCAQLSVCIAETLSITWMCVTANAFADQLQWHAFI